MYFSSRFSSCDVWCDALQHFCRLMKCLIWSTQFWVLEASSSSIIKFRVDNVAVSERGKQASIRKIMATTIAGHAQKQSTKHICTYMHIDENTLWIHMSVLTFPPSSFWRKEKPGIDPNKVSNVARQNLETLTWFVHEMWYRAHQKWCNLHIIFWPRNISPGPSRLGRSTWVLWYVLPFKSWILLVDLVI